MNYETSEFYDVSNDQTVADELGKLRAKIKEMQNAAKFLEDMLKAKRVTAVDGSMYRVTISYDIETTRVNWGKVAAKLNPSHQLIAAHTKRTTSDRVNVSALTKS